MSTRVAAARARRSRIAGPDGSEGWDEYACFYDWENTRTFGRRDVTFWRGLVARARGPVLELGCGTGRLLMPLARSGARVVGLDRSPAMLARAAARRRRVPRDRRPALVRGDIRALPFPRRTFGVVIAPYGMLQSLLHDRDLDQALAAVARVLRPGGVFGIDLVPDLPRWKEYRRRVRLRGRTATGSRVELVESVRQDRRRGWTIFDERFVERQGGRRVTRAFALTFRTLPVAEVTRRLVCAGFSVDALLGGYDNRPWDDRADVWIVLARRAGRSKAVVNAPPGG
jgi:SAM-dependent methyltransferase